MFAGCYADAGEGGDAGGAAATAMNVIVQSRKKKESSKAPESVRSSVYE